MTAAQRGIRRRQRLFVVFTAVLVLAYARQLAVAIEGAKAWATPTNAAAVLSTCGGRSAW